MSTAQPTLYDILGVPHHADQNQIRTAYRALAKQYHPDYNPDDAGAEGAFKAVTRAYEVLSDPDRRARYDKALDDQSKAGKVTADVPKAGRNETVMMVVFVIFLILAVFFFFFDPARGVFFLVIAVALEIRNSVESIRKDIRAPR